MTSPDQETRKTREGSPSSGDNAPEKTGRYPRKSAQSRRLHCAPRSPGDPPFQRERCAAKLTRGRQHEGLGPVPDVVVRVVAALGRMPLLSVRILPARCSGTQPTRPLHLPGRPRRARSPPPRQQRTGRGAAARRRQGRQRRISGPRAAPSKRVRSFSGALCIELRQRAAF